VPDSLDFSFSGIKTAVLYKVRGQDGKAPLTMSADDRADVAASFQEAVVDVLVEQSLKACLRTRTWRLAVGGGVACNTRLREKLAARAAKEGVQLYFPPAKFCTDNAAMVAGLGYHLYKAGRISDLRLEVVPTKAHKP
jgi:N6-L-threonylcarbamoyladenine synthase